MQPELKPVQKTLRTHQNPRWYVVYTRPKTERIVASSISELGIESYLPLQKVVRYWSDRKKKLEMPLFPNYVFVKVAEINRGLLFSIKELVNFISIDKQPVVIRENEILAIKQVLQNEMDVCVEEYFQEGSKVKIKDGQLAGLEGIVVKQNSNARLIVKIDGLMKAFSVNIPTHTAELIPA